MQSVLNLKRLGFSRKLKHVSGVILAAKLMIQFLNGLVTDEYDRCVLLRLSNRSQGFLAKFAQLLRVDLVTPLAIDDLDHFRLLVFSVRSVSPWCVLWRQISPRRHGEHGK